MKEKLIIIGLHFVLLVFALFFSFLYFFLFFNILIEFDLLVDIVGFVMSIALSFAFSIFILLYVIIRFNSQKRTKFSNWLLMNYPKLILYYIISLICFAAIKSEIVWSFEELKEVLSLEWSIFGISIAIFLVWNIVILEYIKKKKPIIPSGKSPIKKMKYIKEKGEFYQDASILFNSVALLVVNLFVILMATSSVYLVGHGINLLNQNIVIISLFFCTNTLLSLFIGILRPLKEEKKEILKSSKISNEEVQLENEIQDKIAKVSIALYQIKNSALFTEEEKTEISKKLVAEFVETSQITGEDTAIASKQEKTA